MPILCIRPRFAAAIIEGTKKMHIFADENEQWASGSPIHFWCGNTRNKKDNPYKLGYAVATKVLYLQIYPAQNKVLLQGAPVTDLQAFAAINGFDSWAEVKAYFGHSFTGVAIHWDSVELAEPPAPKEEEEDKDKTIYSLQAQLAFAQSEIKALKNKLKIIA